MTTHPAPAIVLSRVNLNAQGGLDFRLVTTGYQDRGGEQIPASLIEARAFGTPVLGEWSTLTGLPSRGGIIPLDDADTASKYTFMLVQQLSALQAGNSEHAGPVLTPPIGSR